MVNFMWNVHYSIYPENKVHRANLGPYGANRTQVGPMLAPCMNFAIWVWARHFVGNFKGYLSNFHDDVIKWKHSMRYWPFVRGIHRSPLNSPHKGQWRGALMFSLICVWINDWVNNHEAGDLRRYCAHSDITVMHTKYLNHMNNIILYTKVWRNFELLCF